VRECVTGIASSRINRFDDLHTTDFYVNCFATVYCNTVPSVQQYSVCSTEYYTVIYTAVEKIYLSLVINKVNT
jgi:hypothetical protein